MGRKWECICKDCDKTFSYSDTKYQAGLARGHSRTERCDSCRAHHNRELQSIGQPYYVVKALKPIGDPRRLTSDLGRFEREDRPHKAIDIAPPPIDPEKFGIKDDRLVELFHFFKQDPGLQVVVVVGPTGSGKSTYFPYRLVELPTNYKDKSGALRESYWTVPIESDHDLKLAQEDVKHTILVKGHYRHFTAPPNDRRATAHNVSGPNGLDPKMFWRYGQIVITQPRIQATRNIPAFIAKAMMGCELGAGHDVGFRHSGSPNSDWSTKLAFVTDGTLITWIAKGELDKINTIMIDEAHERSLNIDIIIGMLTQLLPRYPRLRLIIASATIAADKFINHFNKHLPQRRDAAGNILPNCRFMEFEGKSFKVTPHFRSSDETPLDYYRQPLPAGSGGQPRWEGRHRNPADLAKHVAEKAIEILAAMYDHSDDGGYLVDHDGQKIDITERQGDILGFLHGEKPIEECCATVEKLAQAELEGRVKVRALPLYTTLNQDRQDDALKEREQEQPHVILLKKIVDHLVDISLGKRPFNDVLAILNNAGQIHNLCSELEKRLTSEKKLGPLSGKVQFIPWFTPETAKQLFESEDDPRREMKLPPRRHDSIRVIISTTRHKKALRETFDTLIEIKPKEQRVVVSTNVAETSLTIHGILHVVDSGLINQNKWDAATQTSGISPILQSRAGCKQRWGRAGRLQAGDAWLLYTAEQFGKEQGEDDTNPNRVFEFYSLPEIARSPLDQVLLTAKKAGVESLDPVSFPWLDAPDSNELERSMRSLIQKGAIDQDGDLTAHGLELGSMIGIDAKVGNMLVVADRFACAVEMATVIAVSMAERKGLKALFEFNKEWDEQSIQEVRRRQATVLVGCKDDLDAALRIVACWEEIYSAGQAFLGMALLYLNGDELTKELNSSKNPSVTQLIQQIMSVENEFALEDALQRLAKYVKKERMTELRRSAESSLKIRKDYSRLGGVWKAIVKEWSFQTVWSEAVVAKYSNISQELNTILKKLAEPKYSSDPRKLVDLIEKASPPDRKIAVKALDLLPDVASRTWGRANYLASDAIIGVLTSRAELLAPLEAHKKGSEWRPLDLTRNNRLRAIVAHCLPENAFFRSSESSGYLAVAAGVTLNELDVEPASDSVCASPCPDLFICLERRAGPAIEGKRRKLFASFLVSLPTSWREVLADSKNPFHKFSATKLGKFVSEHCSQQPHFGKGMLLDMVYPKGSICRVVPKTQISEEQWEVLAEIPHKRPASVCLRPKRAGDGETVEQEPEDFVRSSKSRQDDFELTKRQQSMEAGVDINDWDKAVIDPKEFESLYRSESNAVQETSTSGNLIALSDVIIKPSIVLEGTTALLISKTPLELVSPVNAEVVDCLTSAEGERKLILKLATTEIERKQKRESFCLANIGREFHFSDLRVEKLPLDGGSVLIARETLMGIEVMFGPKDLSFSSCSAVPEVVFRALGGNKGRFTARLVQVEEDTGRVRLTTHHVFEEMKIDAKACTGRQTATIIQNTPVATYMSLECVKETLARGFMLVARIPEGQILGEKPGSRHVIYATLPSKTTTSWPEGVAFPSDFDSEEPSARKLSFRGPVPRQQLDQWLSELSNRRDGRAAIYSLYERSYQLNAMDEHEFHRWNVSIGRTVNGKVERLTDQGAEIALNGLYGVRTWMPREEFTWYSDEDLSQLKQGEEITVKGLEIDWERRQVKISRRELSENPYQKLKIGGRVVCETVAEYPNGRFLSIDRLRGWISQDKLAWLPNENKDTHFVAEITKIDDKDGKIIVSRWPVVQEKLRAATSNVVLRGRVTEFKDKKALVELAPGLFGTLWVEEVTNAKGRNSIQQLLRISQEIDVIILPPREDDWANQIRISRKQAWSGTFQLSGTPGRFFGSKWNNVLTIQDNCSAFGACQVEEMKGLNYVCLQISGDTHKSYASLVSELQSLATRTNCVLTTISTARKGPVLLSSLFESQPPARKTTATPTPRNDSTGKTPRPGAEAPKAPTPKRGFLSWIKDLFSN